MNRGPEHRDVLNFFCCWKMWKELLVTCPQNKCYDFSILLSIVIIYVTNITGLERCRLSVWWFSQIKTLSSSYIYLLAITLCVFSDDQMEHLSWIVEFFSYGLPFTVSIVLFFYFFVRNASQWQSGFCFPVTFLTF